MQYMFNASNDMEETLSKVTSKEPGFGIVCKSWAFHVSEHSSTARPTGHTCDILTVTESGKVCLWVVVKYLTESSLEYLMVTGRMLKYQLVMTDTTNSLTSLQINCHPLSLDKYSAYQGKAILSYLGESQELQRHCLAFTHHTINVVALQRALARVMLCRESPLKRCLNDHTSIMLSVQQAEVLMGKAKVNYISGPAGSGKSWTAACLYKMYGKENSVYICTTSEFVEYLKFNGCVGMLVESDHDLLKEIKSGSFEDKVCIIIDDSHNFKCTRKSLKKLFELLQQKRQMSLFVFADNDYQSFDRAKQRAMHDLILQLTRQVLQQSPVDVRLTEIHRNTKKVLSFVHSALQGIHDGHQQIVCVNTENGEGVSCVKMINIWLTPAYQNELVLYLCSLIRNEKYNPTEIAVLLDPAYTYEKLLECRGILRSGIPNMEVHAADVFPRRGIIVDSVESFLGLDTVLCVFILSNTERRPDKSLASRLSNFFRWGDNECERSIYNPRYQVFLATRATHMAVFVAPEIHTDLVHQMKFDNFQVSTMIIKYHDHSS